MMRFVNRYARVYMASGCRPSGYDSLFVPVDHCNRIFFGRIQEKSWSRFLDHHCLEAIGFDFEVAFALTSARIHDAQESIIEFGIEAAVRDIEVVRNGVVPSGIRVGQK